MATSTHKINVGTDAYVNVSNGNLNCAVILSTNQSVRCFIGGEQPAADVAEYIRFKCSGNEERVLVQIANLAAEADLWLLAEAQAFDVSVIRGEALVTVAS